jgi:peroxiredoxin
MPIRKGDKAPAFKLSCKPGEQVDLSADLGKRPIVLLFFPLAFSPVCSAEMCQFRDDWSKWKTLDAAVYGISIDSPFVTDRFRGEIGVPFPILSDFNREVSEVFGVLHEDLVGLKNVAKRSAFVIDVDGTVIYDWVTDDPKVQVPFEEIHAALSGVSQEA